MKAVSLFGVVLVASGLVGCAHNPAHRPPHNPAHNRAPTSAQTAAPATAPTKAPARAFSPDTLYALLTAEIAGSRGHYDVALANYLQQAEQTRDPQVAERAYAIARYMDASHAALKSAQLWATSAPDNQDAQAAAIITLIRANRLTEALAKTRKAHTRDNGALIQSIAAHAKNSTRTQREGLLTQYQQLLQQSPNNLPLLIGTGLLLQQQKQPQQALTLARRAMQQDASNTPAVILASGLLHQLKRGDEALTLVKKQLKKQPDNTRMRLQYARLLAFSDIDKAQQQFQQLVDNNPRDPDLLRALALVAEQRGDNKTAAHAYRALLSLGQHTNAAHFYLGKLAYRHKHRAQALQQLLQIKPGNYFTSASAAIYAIYLEQQDPASAEAHYRQLLSQLPDKQYQLTLTYNRQLIQYGYIKRAKQQLDSALADDPHSSRLLYNRSMILCQQGKYAEAEADLKTALQYSPNNAKMLNALGYILADQTSRFSEAYRYIKQALDLRPDDPAIIDSMGWVKYRQGDIKSAIAYLRRAMQAYPDAEIAAHLGEVLWVSGQHRAAQEAWRAGLKQSPHSKYINNTLQKLNVTLEPEAKP